MVCGKKGKNGLVIRVRDAILSRKKNILLTMNYNVKLSIGHCNKGNICIQSVDYPTI